MVLILKINVFTLNIVSIILTRNDSLTHEFDKIQALIRPNLILPELLSRLLLLFQANINLKHGVPEEVAVHPVKDPKVPIHVPMFILTN